MTKRQRPGKRERQAQAAARFAQYRAELVRRNMETGLTPEPKPLDPRLGLKLSVSSRDRLKAASTTMGFHAPRGYYSPKDLVSKSEREGGRLANIPPRATGKPSKRFAKDGFKS